MKTLTLDGRALEAVAGHLDESLRLIESRFLVRVAARGDEVVVTALETGGEAAESVVVELLRQLADLHAAGVHLGRDEIRTAIGLAGRGERFRLADHFVESRVITSARRTVVPGPASSTWHTSTTPNECSS